MGVYSVEPSIIRGLHDSLLHNVQYETKNVKIRGTGQINTYTHQTIGTDP